MGRRPDSAAVQEAKGNPGKRSRRKTVESAIEATELPDGTPTHLSERARGFWGRLYKEVKRLNFVRYTDRPTLERYCEALADYWDLQTKLRGKDRVYWTDTKHGKMKRIEPAVLLMHREEALLMQYEDRLGLNPVARQRILVGMAATQGSLPLTQADEQDKDNGTDAGLRGEEGPREPESPVGLLN